MEKGVTIAGVVPGSIAEEAGIEAGDRLLGVNKRAMEDLIDYKYLASDEQVTLDIRKVSGQEWEIDIEKEYDEDLGLKFEAPTFDQMRRCHNRCIFCFVDQNPGNMRASLYEYDDDFRLSFLYGNFVTLTNLRPADWERIARLRLSPLYVSVHAMDPSVREELLGTPKARQIRQHLDYLREKRIEVHAQVVLCPGINDGEQLDYTITELAGYYPSVRSVAVVPVGLTRYRQHLPPLRSLTEAEVLQLTKEVKAHQNNCQSQLGTRFVWLSDEFFLTYGLPLPPRCHYEDLVQIENGVGLARHFLEEFADALPHTSELPRSQQLTSIVTGMLGAKVLEPVLEKLSQLGVNVKLWTVQNQFFGKMITATGLLTGGDIIRALQGRDLGTELLLPEVMVRSGLRCPTFLDDVTVAQLEIALGVPVIILDGARDLVQHLVK